MSAFYVWRRVGGNLNTKEPRSRHRLPRFKHPTLESANIEAARLSALYPESRFLVMEVVAEFNPPEQQL